MKPKIYFFPMIIIALLTVFDQCVKYTISKSFALYETKPFIKGLFDLTYIQNKGIAWGMFEGGRVIFLILTAAVLVFAFYIFNNASRLKKPLPLKFSLILLVAGALGNMIDRIKLGYVIDFLDFKPFDFPIFNIADIYVVVGMILIFILIIFVYDNDDFDLLIGRPTDKTEELPEDKD